MSKCGTDTPKALEKVSSVLRVTLRSPRSTEPTYVRWSPHISASSSWERFFSYLYLRILCARIFVRPLLGFLNSLGDISLAARDEAGAAMLALMMPIGLQTTSSSLALSSSGVLSGLSAIPPLTAHAALRCDGLHRDFFPEGPAVLPNFGSDGENLGAKPLGILNLDP